MANPLRGEISAVIDGTPRTLVLTLGALAELEAAFGDGDLLTLAERLGRGRLSAADVVRIVGAGLRAAGHAIDDRDVGALRIEGGAAGWVDVVARLLAATFGPATAPVERPGGGKDGGGPFAGDG